MEKAKVGKPEEGLGRVLREGTILGDENGVCIKLSAHESAEDTSLHVSPNGRNSYSYAVCRGNDEIAGTLVHASPYLGNTQGTFVRLTHEQLARGNLIVPVHSADGRYCYKVYSDGSTKIKSYALKHPANSGTRRTIDVLFGEDEGNKFRAEMR